MGWPQITMIVLAAMSVGIGMAKHGEPRGPYSAWAALLGAVFEVWILHAGGFFS